MGEGVKTYFWAFDISNFINFSGRPATRVFHDIGLLYMKDIEIEILKEFFIFDKRYKGEKTIDKK